MRRPPRQTWIVVAPLLLLLLTAAVTGARPAATAKPPRAVDLDVLFIGAHPDDEASGLSTYGQWTEYDDVRTGVITITRGEGGGNAVGTEEGPALGLIREAEERRAVGRAGVRNIYNHDFVDFWFNLSAPLTEELWDRNELLERIVRVVRYTRPEVIVTMNPGINHGHHQLAAWLAVEAYHAAARATAFSGQISDEGLAPWRVGRIFTTRAPGERTNGPDCARGFQPAEPTDVVYGVWSGRSSDRHGKTWAAVERDSQREYATQGWHVFPDVPTDPNQLGCDYFTLIDGRVPFTLGNAEPTAMLEGTLFPARGGLPLGTELFLTTERFRLTGGEPLSVTAHARNGGRRALRAAVVELDAPNGWSVSPAERRLGTLPPGRERLASFTVSPPEGADPGRVPLSATLRSRGKSGTTQRPIEVVPAVQGRAELHPDVARFREWTRQAGAEQVDTLIRARLALGSGESRTVRVDLVNNSDRVQSGTVSLELPPGFAAEPAQVSYSGLEPGAASAVSFDVTNTDATLPTGDPGGDYLFTIRTTSDAGASEEVAALNLVPVTTVPQVESAPALDGAAGAGEYPGLALDAGRLWEGDAPSSPEDASGTARLSWHDDALYVLVEVRDDVLGAVLTPEDAKRHWRTDSVELTLDPRGNSRDTSTTFKVGLFAVTDDPAHGNPPAGYRDADNHQGPIAVTAPGMQLASTVSAPYAGYTIEARIPLSDVPAAVDSERMRFNVLIYDSDTQDRTGQTRLAWSPWGAVQASPYLWGAAKLSGYVPPPGRSTDPREPVIPLDVARSVESPQSILQSSKDRVPLAGARAAPRGDRAWITSRPSLENSAVTLRLRSNGPGTAYVFAWTGERTAASIQLRLTPGRGQEVRMPVSAADGEELARRGLVLVAFEADAGGTVSLKAPIDD
jgi:LmbE family N-acetylglucosaminyl deacetylase